MEQKRGALLGLAWGDVLGCPVEGWREHEIKEVYGTYDDLPTQYRINKIPYKRRKRLRPLGLYSDDTQQALALIHVISHGWSPERWGKLLVHGERSGAWRGIGRNFVAAVHQIRKGEDVRRTGSPSAGIGASMRIGPVGAWYAGEEKQVLSVAIQSTLVTHADQRAAVFAAVVAYVVSSLIHGNTMEDTFSSLPEFAKRAEAYCRKLQQNGWKVEHANESVVSHALKIADGWQHLSISEMRKNISQLARPHLQKRFTRAHPNQGFVLLGGLHALLIATRTDLSTNEILLEIVRQGFDTDTVAAIAGTILGGVMAPDGFQ